MENIRNVTEETSRRITGKLPGQKALLELGSDPTRFRETFGRSERKEADSLR
jgi:hypothetical protein